MKKKFNEFKEMVFELVNDSALPNTFVSEVGESDFELDCDEIDDLKEWFEEFKKFFEEKEKPKIEKSNDSVQLVGL